MKKLHMKTKKFDFGIMLKAIGVCMASPLLFLILLPIFIIREMVKYLAKFNDDLGEVMSGGGSMMACVDDPHGRPRANITVAITMKGEMTVEKLIAVVTEVLRMKKPDGSIVFKELQQYYYSYFGFYFWKWDRKFKVENHIRNYPKQIETDKDMSSAIAHLQCRPWPKNQGLWDLWLSYNEKTDTTLMIYRSHHGLADGYALINLVLKTVGNSHVTVPAPNYPKSNLLSQMTTLLILPFLMIYQAVEEFTYTRDVNDLYSEEKKASGDRFIIICDPIPLTLIKQIMKANSVNFNSVVSAAITGALRKYMLQNQIQVPEIVHAITGIPFPGHPGTLVNHFSFDYSKFPLGEREPQDRLQACNHYFKQFRNSTLPVAHFHAQKLMGGVFWKMSRFITDHLAETTAFYSNFPISNTAIQFRGLPVTDIVVCVGCVNSHTGVGFSCMSYKGNLRVAVLSNQSTIPSLAATQTLANYITEEFKVLSKVKLE